MQKIFHSPLWMGVIVALLIIVNSSRRPSHQVSVLRYDQALMSLDPDHLAEGLQELVPLYPDILDGANLANPEVIEQIYDFITDTQAKELQEEVNAKYPEFRFLEKELGRAFAIYRKEFYDDEKMPRVYAYLSYLDYANRVVFQDSFLVIAADMYLGDEETLFYAKASLPRYICERLDKPFISSDVMRSVAHYELGNQPTNDLLDWMILHGKVQYFLEQTLPKTEEHFRLGYRPQHLSWSNNAEAMIWSYLVEKDLLYTTDPMRYRAFVQEGPTVAALPGSPGRLGHFVGYRIVQAYMKKSGIGLKELFALQDSRAILRESGYRPS